MRRPFLRSRPGGVLLYSTLLLIAVTFALPYLPFARIFGFVPLPAALVVTLAAITCLNVVAAEITRRRFYRNGR
jgi:P-type Mg2+ transporter